MDRKKERVGLGRKKKEKTRRERRWAERGRGPVWDHLCSAFKQ
jgi:hypothetical protein